MAEITKYDWEKGEDVPVPGTEDFERVAGAYASEYYDWAEIGIWYSPSRRQYFWLSECGCSCNYFAEDVRGIDSFQFGTRDSAIRAAKAWAAAYAPGPDSYQTASTESLAALVHDVATHRPGVTK